MIFIREAGAGPALLLLHAFPYDSRQWIDQIARLSRSMRVLAPDFPGFGRSAPPTAAATIDGVARELLERLRALDVRRALVVGNSFGGYIALALFHIAPEFFTGFGFVNSRAAADDDSAKAKRVALIRKAKSEGVGFLLDGASESERSMIADATVDGFVAAQCAIAGRLDATALLPSISCPSSVIWGTADPLVPSSEGRAIAAALPDCFFEPIDGAGHVPSLDRPAEVSASLERLAARCLKYAPGGDPSQF